MSATITRYGLTTRIQSGVHDITVSAAMAAPGIVIKAGDDCIVVPAEIVLDVLEAVLRTAPAGVRPYVFALLVRLEGERS